MKVQKDKIIRVKKFPLFILASMFLLVLVIALSQAQFTSTSSMDVGSTSTVGTGFAPSAQYYRPGFEQYYSSEQISTYWAEFGKEECEARQDFILNIRPGGCTPAVVRSDLLEEQNVPIFCKLDAIKINPLIDVKSIRSISFKGQYPKEVAGISFHPARAAIRTYNTLLGSPLLNNVGYLVIVLRRQPSEDDMPDWVQGNLTAIVRYDAEKAFGVGDAEYYIPVLQDNEWQNNYEEYSFWRGRGFLRANWVDEDRASISVYRDRDHKESTLTLREGESSGNVYLGGFYCQVALDVRLNEITYPQTIAKIKVHRADEENNLWLYEGAKFADDKCRVTNIEPIILGGGSVDISCSGGERFTLYLGSANSVDLEINNKEQKTNLWDLVNEDEKVYLSYIGQLPQKISTRRQGKENSFILLIKTEKELSVADKEKLERNIKNIFEYRAKVDENRKDFEEQALVSLNKIQEISGSDIIFYKRKGDEDFSRRIKFVEPKGVTDEVYGSDKGQLLNENFDKSISNYRDVVKYYPYEKVTREAEIETYGEQALVAAVELADKIKKQGTKQELLQETISNYPDTSTGKEAEKEFEKTIIYDEEKAGFSTRILQDYYSFQLKDIKQPTKEEASTTIILDNGQGTYSVDEYVKSPETNDGKTEFIQVQKLNDEYVELKYAAWDKEKGDDKRFITKTTRIRLDEYASLGRFQVYISDIQLEKVAHVSVEPVVIGPETETNVSFKIGIEKRAIDLSTDKTKEKIEDLNSTIEKWEDLSEKLAKVIKGWKGACFATSALLLVKNLVDNFSGKSMARQKVMRGPGGWFEKCNEMIKSGERGYVSLDDCLRQNNDKIEQEVSAAHNSIQKVNNLMQNTEKVTETALFGEKVLNTDDSFKGFMSQFKSRYGDETIEVDGKEFKMNDMVGDYEQGYNNGYYGFNDARDWMYYLEMVKNPQVSEDIKKEYKEKLYDEYKAVENKRKAETIASGYEDSIEKSELGGKVEVLKGGKRIPTTNIIELDKNDYEKLQGFDRESGNVDFDRDKRNFWIRMQTPANLVIEKGKGEDKEDVTNYAGKIMLVRLSKTGDSYSPVPDEPAYILEKGENGEKVTGKVDSESLVQILDKSDVSRFIRVEKGKCNNPYKEKPVVRFYETEPYRKMPAVVPFDVEKGWYVATKQIIKGFGMTPYTEAGVVRNFYLCNIGENGREDFQNGMGDDICTFISFETGASPNHPCLNDVEARNMANKAREALLRAAQQHGNKKIEIYGETLDTGAPAGGAEGTQCQDFMSPEDCYVLFNVCDPVLCPPSRCNLGGNYYVKDVIQSGIIGSIVLCLPNAKEGIFVPVCLTGIQAGIDAFVSILKSTRDCLQESLDTGRHVGICDEIMSVYLCEFFWRQLAPLLDVFIPKMVEMAYGQGTRGGGEYLTVQHAWNTMQNSVNYFKQHYAQNAMEAFNMRSTDQVGSEFCKMFVSSTYPSSDDFLDNLLEPESPVQYHAWFDEIPHSEATVPATSHYKVFYHIWAGKDRGAHYAVYLKEPPESSYYANVPTITVDTGYIGKGDYLSRTKDFTAPAGYKTLCVRVNLQEECGFGQVSTSYAVNALKEGYIEEQSTQKVTTEDQCISGNPSLYPLAQPNIQEGVQEAAQPQIYKRGIIRVCSTDNPGKQTNPEKWKDVGYCGNEKVRCWLDVDSVEGIVKDERTMGRINQSVGDIEQQRIQELVEQGEMLSESESAVMLDWADNYAGSENFQEEVEKSLIGITDAEALAEAILDKFKQQFYNKQEGEDVFDILDKVQERGFLNKHKAKAILLRAQIYDFVTRQIYDKFFKEQEQQGQKDEDGGDEEGGDEDEEILEEPEKIGTKVKDSEDIVWKKIDIDNNKKWFSEKGTFSWNQLKKRGPLSIYKEQVSEIDEETSKEVGDIEYEDIEKGFYLKQGQENNEIYFNEENTGLYLENLGDNKYGIYAKRKFFNIDWLNRDLYVGYIIRENIHALEDDEAYEKLKEDTKDYLDDLTEYNFNNEGFVKV